MDEPLATLKRREHDDGVLVRVTGEIDMSNVDLLHDEILETIGQVESASLDLGQVRYIDSQGLRLLKRLSDRLALAGIELTIVAPPDSVAGQLLAITQMSSYLRIVPA
jgi:stage II sporulation protein AA (anti-sigma F factor antagonist)